MHRRAAPILAALALVLTTVGTAVASTDPFTRSWSATDFDGSLMSITFSGTGDTREFSYRDDRATTCGGGAYEASGTGTITGDTIALDPSGGCVGGGDISPVWLESLTYLPASGTLFDGTVHWYRGNRAHEAFIGVWKATDVDGSAMKVTFRSTGQLTRDVTFLDDYASSCGGAVFMSAGEGTIGSTPGQGRFITLAMHGGCLGGSAFDYAEKYEYLAATDTLFGPLGLDGNDFGYAVTWYRG